jgi:hypothetical protein
LGARSAGEEDAFLARASGSPDFMIQETPRMSTSSFDPLAPPPSGWQRHRKMIAWTVGTVGLSYLMSAYVFLPWLWGQQAARHPVIEDSPRITQTRNRILGDPLNIALIGSEREVAQSLTKAGWLPADPITWKSCLRISRATLLKKPYETAPVSNLYLWGRKQDLAFQYPVGRDPRRRHHVRFWRAPKAAEDGRPIWMGAATYDSRVGLSRRTGQITHHIDGNVDAERDKLLRDLRETGLVDHVSWIEDFHKLRQGRNGGGDRWYTDGRLAVAVLVPEDEP